MSRFVYYIILIQGIYLFIMQSCDTLTTALHEAASTNDIEVVKYLLSVGADITLVNLSGEQSFDCTTIPEIRK